MKSRLYLLIILILLTSFFSISTSQPSIRSKKTSAIQSLADVFFDWKNFSEGDTIAVHEYAKADSVWSVYSSTYLWNNLLDNKIEKYQHHLNQTDSLFRKHASSRLLTVYKPFILYAKGHYSLSTGDFYKAAYYLQQSLEGLSVADRFAALISIEESYEKALNYPQAIEYQLEAQNKLLTEDSSLIIYNYQSPYLFYYLVNKSKLLELYTETNNKAKAKKIALEVEKAYDRLWAMPYFSEHISYQLSRSANNHRTMLLYNKLDLYDSAAYFFRQAIKFASQPTVELVELYQDWGKINLERNFTDSAGYYFAKALLINRNLFGHSHYRNAEIYNSLGQVNLVKGKPEEAREQFNQALKILKYRPTALSKLQNPSIALEAILGNIHSLKILNPAWAAQAKLRELHFSRIEEASAITDRLQLAYSGEESKEALAVRTRQFYEVAIEGARQSHQATGAPEYLEVAFKYMEKSKSAGLRQAVKTAQARHFANIPAKVLDEESRLQGLIYYYKNALATSQDSIAKVQLQDKLFETNRLFEQFTDKLKNKYTRYYQFKYDPAVQILSEVKKTVVNKTSALLEYFLGEEAIYVIVASTSGSDLLKLPKKSLEENVISYTKALQNPKSKDLSIGYELYTNLLAPALAKLPSSVTKLIIVPDGELGYLPFDALPTENVAKGSSALVQAYLFSKYATRREYSATLILEKAKAQESAEKPQLAYAGFAPAYEQSMALPFNQGEVGFLQKLFGGTPYLGANASEKNFRNNAPNSRIIHFAGHAQANSNAELSGFQFPAPAKPDSVNDGYLYISELYNLPLKADLAILSACETGVGKLTKGEGIISLARAFQYAGCPTVAMTLWKVNDRATATIIELFSKNLSKGMPKDRALQQARIDFLKKEPALVHPYYWAGIVLVGNDKPLAQGGWFRWYYWVLIIILGIIIIFTLIKLRRKPKYNRPN